MKRIKSLLTVFLLAMVSLPLSAQQPPEKPFSPEDFRKHLESFIVKEACLSPTEASAFFPIYHELHDKQQGINWQIRELKKRCLPANATDKDYLNVIKEIKKLNVESAELDDLYYKKMCKEIPAKKVFDAMKAEDTFHRKALHKFSKKPEKPKEQ